MVGTRVLLWLSIHLVISMDRLHLFSKKFGKGRRSLSFGTNPEADWKFIFIYTVVIILLVTLFNIVIFIKIDKGEIFTTERPLEEEKGVFNLAGLKNTVSYYQNKGLEFERIKKEKVPTADPSL
jgi:hypothetical protein